MFTYAAVVIVAVATSHVAAQTAAQPNRKFCGNEQFLPDPTNCRLFYKCGNDQWGTRLNCSEGTLYNAQDKGCNTNATCVVWANNCNTNQRPASGIMTYGGLCCHGYYEYNCNSHTWKYRFCTGNSDYDNGRCLPSVMRKRACTDCRSLPQLNDANSCSHTNQKYVDDCRFNVTTGEGIEVTLRCSPGERMSQKLCRCVQDYEKVCASKNQQTCSSSGGNYLDLNKKKFMVGTQEVYTMTENRTDFIAGQTSRIINYYQIPYFNGMDITYPASGFLVRFAMSAPYNSGVIMTTNTGCNSPTVFEVKIDVSGSTAAVTVILRRDNAINAIMRSSNFQTILLNQPVTVSLAVSGRGSKQQGKIMVGNNIVANGFSSSIFANAKGSNFVLGCALKAGDFRGTLMELKHWKCSDIAQLNFL